MHTSGQAQAVYLKDYQVPPFLIHHIDLTFHLNAASTRVLAVMQVRRNSGYPENQEHLVLDGEKLSLIHIKINHKVLSVLNYEMTLDNLTIYDVPDEFELEIATEINPEENTELSGLYSSQGILVTQCESQGFRRMTYFLDRPDVLSTYMTTLVADANFYPVLLSNGNLIEQGVLENGQRWTRWSDPFPKPSYLFALVAGQLSLVEDTFETRSGRQVKIWIYVQKQNLTKCEQAMNSVKRAMKWDEETFGREYDLDNYMIVAVDDFNFGAMENKGLNIFNAKYVLARPDTATDQDYLNVQSVIAHEYFHNWTGNRITCRDWFQLSLKEGLTIFREQEFQAAMTDPIVARIQDVSLLRTEQFAQDSSSVAHPVQPSSYMEISNFYTVTIYEKGAEIIRMMQTMLGKDKFMKGMDLYFSRYDGQAVTIQDLVKTIAEANSVNFSQFIQWYTQSGTPEVYVLPDYDFEKKQLTLKIEQLLPPTPGQWVKTPLQIPVKIALFDTQGEPVNLQRADDFSGATQKETILELTQMQQEFKFLNIPPKVTPSLLRQFSAPIKLYYPYSKDDLLFLLENDNDMFNRWDILQRLWSFYFKEAIEALKLNEMITLDENFIRVFNDFLTTTSISPYLQAQFIALPSERSIAQAMEKIDIDHLLDARRILYIEIAKACEVQFWRIFAENFDLGPYQTSIDQIGRRAIKNIALDYLITLGSEDIINQCHDQFNNANNMTDRLAAFLSLNNIACEQREKAIFMFYDMWQEEPLVLDKWFAVQAQSQLPDTLRRVIELTKHPRFDFKNPNRVSALIGSFCKLNWLHFHAIDGSGYAFLSEMLLVLDSINPMVAARMVEPLVRWQRLDEQRQKLMKSHLALLLNNKLSKDLQDMVMRGLHE